MRTREIKVSEELGAPTLPAPDAPLKEHRAAVRAIRVLYPGVKVELVSKIPYGDGVEERGIKV